MKIQVKKRKTMGRKVKGLHKEGVLPGVVYGPKREPVNIKLDENSFNKVFEDAGYSKIIDLEIEGEKKAGKALIRVVQYNPVYDQPIHVSFYYLDLAKEITADVPVITKGASKAVKDSIGFLVTPIESLSVRCLPENLPSEVVIDISGLDKIGDSISIKDVMLPDGVVLAEELGDTATLAFITPPQKEIVEEEPVEEGAVEEEEEGAVEEEEEGEVEEGAEEKPAEGEVKGEAKPQEVEQKE